MSDAAAHEIAQAIRSFTLVFSLIGFALNIAILIGKNGSHVFFALLLFIPYILFTVTSFHYTWWLILPLITLPKAFQLEREFRTGNLQNIPKRTAKLNLYFGLFYLIACCMSKPSDCAEVICCQCSVYGPLYH